MRNNVIALLLIAGNTIPAISQAYSLDEWVANGFTRHEAELFEGSKFSFDEARQWLKHVFDAGHAVSWRDNGFTIEQAEQWQSVGILDGHLARALIDNGYPLNIIQQWFRFGARSIADIRRLVEAGFTLESARAWHALGYLPADWIAFLKHGYGYEDAKKWRALGFKSFNDIRELTRQGFELNTASSWSTLGIPYGEWAAWSRLGFTVNEVAVWRHAGFRDPNMAAQLKKSGISPEVAQQWGKLGLPFRDWKKLYGQGLSLSELKGWTRLGIKSASLIAEYRSLSLTPQSLTEWKEAGVTSFSKIKQYVEQGFASPSDITAWRELGIQDAPRWVAAGVLLNEATQWANVGITDLYTVLNNKRQGRTPHTAVRPWRIPSVYWGIAGVAVITAFFFLAAYWEEFLAGFAAVLRKFRPSR